jgi:hypothetical protein
VRSKFVYAWDAERLALPNHEHTQSPR